MVAFSTRSIPASYAYETYLFITRVRMEMMAKMVSQVHQESRDLLEHLDQLDHLETQDLQ